jgi:hypothetical protein
MFTKFLTASILGLLLLAPAAAQQLRVDYNPTRGLTIVFPVIAGVGNTGWFDLTGYPEAHHMLYYTVIGTATAISVAFDCSDDGSSTKAVIGTAIDPKSGRMSAPDTACAYIRGRVDTNTGGTGVKFTYIGLITGRPPCNAVRKTNCEP